MDTDWIDEWRQLLPAAGAKVELLQRSNIRLQEILEIEGASRRDELVWIVDCRDAYARERIKTRVEAGYVAFRWGRDWMPLGSCLCQVIFDLGGVHRTLVWMRALYQGPCVGWGRLLNLADLLHELESPQVRLEDACQGRAIVYGESAICRETRDELVSSFMPPTQRTLSPARDGGLGAPAPTSELSDAEAEEKAGLLRGVFEGAVEMVPEYQLPITRRRRTSRAGGGQ